MNNTPITNELAREFAGKRLSSREAGAVWSLCRDLERELADAREQCCQAINDYETALRNIMQNEKAMHRMDYNPYLIASAALKGGSHE